MKTDVHFLREALRLALANIEEGGRPFGAVVVKQGEIIATGVNEIVATNDPTAHAELLAIRAAGQGLGSPDLSGCKVYASGQPCPMCMAAMRMAGISEVIFAHSNADAAPYGLSTAAIAEELCLPHEQQRMKISYQPLRLKSAPELYARWHEQQ